MGKGKRSSGNNYVSKGERASSISTRNVNVCGAEKLLRKANALKKGKRIVYTIANPNKNETNRPYIRMMYDMRTPNGVDISKPASK